MITYRYVAIMRRILIIILSVLAVVTVCAQSTRTYYWESNIKFFTGVPEIEEAECDDCGIKVYYNSQGKATKVTYFENGEMMNTDKIRYIGKENGSNVYEVLGRFGTGTRSAQHYFINNNNVLKVHYQFVLDGPYSTDGHFTDTPSFAFKYVRKQ